MLELIELSVFRGGKKIINNINLSFNRSEIHVLLGANGSGKSTLAQGIMGIYPTEGRVILDGDEIDGMRIYERAQLGLSIAFQEPARFEGIKVRDYLLLSSRDKRMGEVEDVIKDVGLPKTILFQEIDDTLSGGERKRIELASVMLMKPKFAILDEIDSGIDMISFRRIGDAILKMKKSGTGIILITHNEDMINIGDVASIICRGKVIKTGVPEEIRNMFTNNSGGELMDIKEEYRRLVEYYQSSGGDVKALSSSEFASLVINHDRVLYSNSTDGIIISADKIDDGVKVRIEIKDGYRSKYPVHLCFGMLPREGRQVIDTQIVAGRKSKVKFLSHCIFPNAVNIEHIMNAQIDVGAGAVLEYEEIHVHGKTGKIKVVPRAQVKVGDGGEYNSTFEVKTGRAGEIDIDYEIHLGKESKSMLLSKVYGRYDDSIRAKESMYLEGDDSKGLIKTRMVLKGESRSEVVGEIVGIGKHSRGHVDCMEIIMDSACARASPVVVAKDPTAKVTHEAAIGSVDKKQLLTLMCRGLTEEEAVDVIVGGLLK